jgi:hypothetical protein
MFFLLQSNFWQRLEKLDQWIFIQINTNSANPFFDALMPFMRYPLNWAPFMYSLGIRLAELQR